MNLPSTQEEPDVLHYPILGSRRLSNLFFAVMVAIGGIGFSLAGLSSFLHIDLLPNTQLGQLQFVPQGVALCFYGAAAILLDLYLWFVIALDVGSGYNAFDRAQGKVILHRQGFWGKDRVVHFEHRMADVLAIRVDIKNGLNPKRSLYLKIKGMNDIPLSEVGQPLSLSDLEDRAATLARFLGVPLEGL